MIGFLFDLDGTMADTDAAHFVAFNRLLAEFGKSITLEFYRSHIIGASNSVIMRTLFPEFDTERHIELANRKESLFRSMSATLAPVDGLLDLLTEAARDRMPVGVVTNAPRANAEHTLRALGLDHLLATAVIGEEIARGKPDPLPYRTGLKRIGRTAEQVIAFEDSVAGVTAASAAGIYTVGITTSLAAETLIAAGADRVIADFRDHGLRAVIDRAKIDGLIQRASIS